MTRVGGAFPDIAAPCTCSACHALDTQHPNEGRQLALTIARLPATPPPARQAKRGRTVGMPCDGPAKPSTPTLPDKEIPTRRSPMSVTTMTIDALCVSPFNARINDADANAVTGMAESLMSRGQLYPLVVHPMKAPRGKPKLYGALAGGRRYRAFCQLIDAGKLPADHPIEVIVRDITDEGELRELSLAENLVRRDLRAYEIFAAVARAHAKGRSFKEIADTNGQTVEQVRRWVRLGNLHPTVFAALETGAIGQDLAKAIAATEDVALQLYVFEQLETMTEYNRTPQAVRRLLKIGNGDLEKTLRFVGEEAYRDAGGRYELDLFADQAEQRGRVVDEGLLMQLADAKLDVIRALTRRQAGRELRFEKDAPRLSYAGYDQGEDRSLEITAEPEPADAHDAQRLAFVRHRMFELEQQAAAAVDDEGLAEDVRQQLIAAIDEEYVPLQEDLAALTERMTIALPQGQVFATLRILDDGGTELRFWWADRKAKQKAEAAARKQADPPPPPRAVSAGPIGTPPPTSAPATSAAPRPLAGSGAAIDGSQGYGVRSEADALARDEFGLTADGVQVMRSIRREVLRAALVGDGLVALDYLLWSLARERLTEVGIMVPGQRSYERGMAGLAIRHDYLGPHILGHVERTKAHRQWKDAVAEMKAHRSMTERDLVGAFDAFRADVDMVRCLAASVIVGCALERSANAGGYEVELHDHLALLAGVGADEDVRALVEPTEELLGLLPKNRQLELVHPHVANAEYLRLEKLKAADLTAPVTRALKKAKGWVHPMLRFRPRLTEIMKREPAREAAE